MTHRSLHDARVSVPAWVVTAPAGFDAVMDPVTGDVGVIVGYIGGLPVVAWDDGRREVCRREIEEIDR